MRSKDEREIVAIGGSQYNTDSAPVLAFETFIPEIIISGGQTGADMGGLLGARDLGIATSGCAPKGWRTENGPREDLGFIYGLTESPYDDYKYRTEANIDIADVTIIVARNFDSAGTALTRRLCIEHGKPVFEVPYPVKPKYYKWSLESEFIVPDVKSWIYMHEPDVINIAGNRESKAPGIQDWTRQFVKKLFV